MKQWVTEEQFNELTSIQKETWDKWCRDHHYLFYEINKYMPEIVSITKDSILNFPSIGEMIEFLDGYSFMPAITRFDNNEWIVACGKNPVEEGRIWREPNWFREELCDSLWEAVKDVLNKSS